MFFCYGPNPAIINPICVLQPAGILINVYIVDLVLKDKTVDPENESKIKSCYCQVALLPRYVSCRYFQFHIMAVCRL